MVAEIFPGYTNHYNSNPYLPKADILSGYKEWVSSFLTESDKMVWLATRDGQPAAFATCSFEPRQSYCEGVLYGVMPQAAGAGVYGDLIRFTQSFFKSKGYRTMKVSTQVQNYAAQKVWNRESFVLRESLNTVHINSFLSCSRLEEHSFELKIRPEDVESFGEVSGDRNPLHFDDEFARARGFEKRVAHGLIANSVLSRYFGTEFPGPGTLFMGYHYKFLRPLYLDTSYRVVVSIPYFVEAKGIYRAVAKIYDKHENLCLVSYNDLIRPPE